MSTLLEAFGTLRSALNDALAGSGKPFLEMVSMNPKHPEFVESADEFPYWGVQFVSERPEYSGTNIYWSVPSQTMAQLRFWLVVGRSEIESATVDLLTITTQFNDAIVALTLSRNICDFRVRVDSVDCEYEPSGRWALATIIVTVGAYGN